jgi:hypothetical protein
MRARGANALLRAFFETVYGTPGVGNYLNLPFVKSDIGEEQGLLDSDLLGQGRESADPTLDVINNDGNLTVPVDVRAFGYWLMLYLGEPTTSASGPASGDITFSAQPAADSTITINGTAFTFKASGATGNQSNIGASLSDTLDSLVTVLNGSVVSGVAQATYSKVGSKLHIVNDAVGLAGNSFTLAAGAGSNGTVSAATLTGGSNAHVFTSGAQDLPSLSIEVGNPEARQHHLGGDDLLQLPRQGRDDPPGQPDRGRRRGDVHGQRQHHLALRRPDPARPRRRGHADRAQLWLDARRLLPAVRPAAHLPAAAEADDRRPQRHPGELRLEGFGRRRQHDDRDAGQRRGELRAAVIEARSGDAILNQP